MSNTIEIKIPDIGGFDDVPVEEGEALTASTRHKDAKGAKKIFAYSETEEIFCNALRPLRLCGRR